MTSIEWTDTTWNVVVGCSRVSAGCDHCYAMSVAHRKMSPQHVGLTKLRPKDAKRPGIDWTGEVRFLPERLAEPLHWRKPRRVFVNSMSDLFHESLSFEQIAAVFGVMAACPQHTLQCLTKRPRRAAEFLTHPECRNWIAKARDAALVDAGHDAIERWSTIPGFDWYEASTHGRIRSERGVLSTHINPQTGRESVTLWRDGGSTTVCVHVLVLEAHRPKPASDLEVCHRNGNKLDNRLANLRWGTRSENQLEKVQHGSRGGPQKLTPDQVADIRAALARGEKQQPIADRYGVSRSLVSLIGGGRVWVPPNLPWPLPNVHLGVSVEDQATADERIPILLECPAAVRWVSYEPALGPVDFNAIGTWRGEPMSALCEQVGHVERPALDWIVVGGESGPGARPFNLTWARSVIADCHAIAGGPRVFVKQLGAWTIEPGRDIEGLGRDRVILHDRKGGDMDEWRAHGLHDICVREFPREVAL